MIEPAAATRVIEGIEYPAVGTWLIDPDLTSVRFRVHHLMHFPLHGSFSSVSGVVAIADDPADSTVVVEIATATVGIGAGGHDGRLRSTEHLDVEHHPAAAFRSRRVRWQGRHARVGGELTLRGVTNTVDLDVRYWGTVVDPWGVERAGFSAVGSLDRVDWGVGWNVTLEGGGQLVSRRVRVDISVEAVRRTASQQPPR